MDQQSQALISFTPPDNTAKKRRGRPRKDKSQSPAKAVNKPRKKHLSQTFGNSAPVPPGFGEANGIQPQPVVVVNNNNAGAMVGQVVTGVIEAVFDAGYLLSVRVGESDTCLRGVVFKAGHYVPVTVENDIAPSLQMIKRSEVPFPVGAQSHKHHGREESEHPTHQSNGLPPLNQVSQGRARQLSIVAAPTPSPYTLDSRGTVVPVVLQPVNLSNGATPAIEAPPLSSQPAHLAATKIKNSTPIHPVQEGTPKNHERDIASASQPFEELVSAAKKRKGSSESAEIQNDGGDLSSKMGPNGSALIHGKGDDLSKPLMVTPLQVIHPGLPHQAGRVPHTFPERRAGKMTELLLAVQENLERQRSEGQHPEFNNPER